MKKLVGLSVIVILFSLTMNAQVKKGKKRQASEFTSEQIATLQAKKMALRIDLDANQQKAVHKVLLKAAEERQNFRKENMQKRKDGVKPTSEERFNMENIRLEKQLAHKNEMKKILNKDQYEKWQKVQVLKMRQGKKKIGHTNSKGMKKGKRQKGTKNKI